MSLDHRDWLLIDQAAAGQVSGTLAEWPWLAEALARAGHVMPPGTPADQLIALCKQIIQEECDA